MLAKKYRSEVISILNPIDGIYTIEFKSLEGKYKYCPGQFLHLALDQEYDGSGQWPESRCFSMQSNPHEEIIKISYSVKGRFTQLMQENLKEGNEVWLKLPYGNLFTQNHKKVNTVFIAGGTGITPFLSLFTHESFRDYINPRIYLGFKSMTFNVYNDVISGCCNSSKVMKIFYEDIDGIIDIQEIFNENSQDSDYFISGPPAMIRIFRQALLKNNVNLDHILTDEWE